MSAVVAAMGAGLAAMVGQLTYGKRQWESLDTKAKTTLEFVIIFLADAFHGSCFSIAFPRTQIRGR